MFIYFSTGRSKKGAFRKGMYDCPPDCREILKYAVEYFSTSTITRPNESLNSITTGHG